LGVAPLVVATGAGAEMRRTLGVAVFSGMLGVTAFGLLLTPVFYYVIESFVGGRKADRVKHPVERREQPVAIAVVEPLPKA
jgi:multidrug efflux pump